MPLPANAQTIAVAMEPYREKIDVMGSVASASRSQISAKLSATVDRVFASAGQAVTNGELLVKLDDRDLKTQLAAAQVQFAQAETERQRVTKLFDQQAATEQMKTAAESAAIGARTQLDRALVAMSWAEIRSPLNGVVTDKQINEGDLANPGQPLLSVYDPKQLRLEVAVPARLIPLITLNADVSVSLENPARDAKGRVEEIVSEADPASRTQKVKVRLQDAADLRPGQFGRLWIELPARDAMFVPSASVYRSGQLEFVQVVADGRAEPRLVKTGRSDGSRVEILSGLKAGEKILAQPVM
jgi:RND family efflux transporter MFP subunit